MSRVFVDIDTQFDFMDAAGALYVPGAQEIVPNLRELTRYATQQGIPVIQSACAHLPDDPEFEQFPPHCIRGTPGAERIEATRIKQAAVLSEEPDAQAAEKFRRAGAVILLKRTFPFFSNPNADAVVEAAGDVEFVVYGVATDYCVRGAVMGLLDRRKRVAVVIDAVRAVDADAGRRAIDEFGARGARFTTTSEIIGRG